VVAHFVAVRPAHKGARGNRPLPRVAVTAAVLTLISVLLAIAPTPSVSQVSVSSHVHTFGCTGGIGHDSTNWSGEIGLNSSLFCNNHWDNFTVTHVSGSWIQPSVNCTHNGIAEMWVGIDGVNATMGLTSGSTTIERTGSYASCWAGNATYFLFWQLVPATILHHIPTITVRPGDSITASVTYVTSKAKFTLMVADGNQSFTKKAAEPGTLRSSAECILSRPSLNHSVADFGKTRFTSCFATMGGVARTIFNSPTEAEVPMVNRADNEAVVLSGLTGVAPGPMGAFNVTWEAYY
jgi:peptidase A4-like protein